MSVHKLGFAGVKGSGKTTCSDICVKYGYKKLSHALPLKLISRIKFKFTEDQIFDHVLKEKIDERWGVSPRIVFQRLGTDFFRDRFPELFPEIDFKKGSIWVQNLRYRILENIDLDVDLGMEKIKAICKCLFLFSYDQLYNLELMDKIDDRWNISPKVAIKRLGEYFESKDFWDLFPEIKKGNKLEYNNIKYVIEDIRFEDEYQSLVNLGFDVYKVKRDSKINKDMHKSETTISKLKIDNIINNNGSLEDLECTLVNIIESKSDFIG